MRVYELISDDFRKEDQFLLVKLMWSKVSLSQILQLIPNML